MNYQRSTAVLAGALTLLAVPASQAALVIDQFDHPHAGQSTKALGGGTTSHTGNVASAGVLGGTRNIAATVESSGGNVEASVNDIPHGLASFFAVTTSATADGEGTITYDGGGSGLALNISPWSLFSIDEVYNDSFCVFSVTFYSASGVARGWVSHGAGAGYSLSISLGTLFTLGTFDPLNVNKIVFVADPQATGGDVQLDALELVPEPSTYAMIAGLGLMGFGIVRRMRRA